MLLPDPPLWNRLLGRDYDPKKFALQPKTSQSEVTEIIRAEKMKNVSSELASERDGKGEEEGDRKMERKREKERENTRKQDREGGERRGEEDESNMKSKPEREKKSKIVIRFRSS